MSTSYVNAQSPTWTGDYDDPVRRTPFKWLSRAGIGLLSFFASKGEPATAGDQTKPSVNYANGPVDRPVEEPIPECCSLARPDRECHYEGEKSNFTCPEGFHQQHWTCCEGTSLVACAECTTSTSTCWTGSFDCSIWWNVGGTC